MLEFELLSTFELHYENPKILVLSIWEKLLIRLQMRHFQLLIKHKFLIFESNKLKSKGRIQLNGQLNKDLYVSRFNGTTFTTTRPLGN